MEEDCECCECDARRNAARILSKPDVEAVRERAMENRITALRRLVLVMEACVDEAEVYHECLSRGWNYNDLKKESE